MATLAGYRTELTAFCESCDAAELLTSEAEAVVRDATAIVNLASTIRMLAAKRVAESASWKHRGHRAAADWLARETKCGVGDAISALEAAEKILECPQVEAKARAGGLSGEQTTALAKAVSADPAAEDRLLGVAERDGLGKLKDECHKVELSTGDAEARHARIHRERSVRHWTDAEGAFRLAAKLTPEAGATVLGALAPFEKAAFDRARTEKRHEPHEAYLADAVVDLARASLSGIDGCDAKPKSRKPYIPTMLKVALAARDRQCAVAGCNRTEGLEIDHIVPVENGGPTTYDNLWRPCHYDHHENKHRRGLDLDADPDRGPP